MAPLPPYQHSSAAYMMAADASYQSWYAGAGSAMQQLQQPPAPHHLSTLLS